VLLYAIEGQNPFKMSIEDTNQRYRHDLFELNQAFWLGQLSRTASMVVPFNEGSITNIKSELLE
jgi:hypothetical protein